MSYISRRSVLVAVACLGAGVFPATVRAQQAEIVAGATGAGVAVPAAPAVVARDVAPAVPVGPRVAPAGIDTRALVDAGVLGAPQGETNLGAGSNLALMGAGAAAVIVGLIIGGDGGAIIAVGGGVLGLVGLFRYIR